MSTRRDALRGGLGLAAGMLLTGCRAGVPARNPPGINVSGSGSLRYHAASAGLLYGCAVDVKALREDVEYSRLLRQQCSILVAENCMKWSFVEPERGRLWFDDGDFVVAYGEKASIKVRGHCLLWHEQLPRWLERSITRENALELLTSRVRTMCSRYSGRMHSWDVVNEAIRPEDGRPDGLRDSIWLRNLGPEYIEIAFRVARAADPAALLTYNEWGLESDSAEDEERRRILLTLLRRLRARNVPIDAVGIQSHLHVSGAQSHRPVYANGLRRFIAALRELGLQVFLTELDVDDSGAPAEEARRDAAVSQVTSEYLNTALGDDAVRAVLTWGITTRHTWMTRRYHNPGTRGLPFDDRLQPLGMFAAIRDSFDTRQGARAGGKVREAATEKVQRPRLPQLR